LEGNQISQSLVYLKKNPRTHISLCGTLCHNLAHLLQARQKFGTLDSITAKVKVAKIELVELNKKREEKHVLFMLS